MVFENIFLFLTFLMIPCIPYSVAEYFRSTLLNTNQILTSSFVERNGMVL